MDFNDLYSRHQISLYMSQHAPGAPARAAHLALAEGYAAQIDAAKRPEAGAGSDVPADPGLVIAFRNVEIVA